MSRFQNPFEQFTDEDGKPYQGGSVFFGLPNQDPINNPKAPFSDKALQIDIGAKQVLDDKGMFETAIYLNGAYSVSLFDIEDNFIKTEPELTGVFTNAVKDFRTRISAVATTSNLSVGDVVQTLGLNTVGDGAAGLYEVVAAGTGTDDGGEFIDSDELNAYQLKLITTIVNGLHWGVKGGGATDNSITYKAAIDFAFTKHKGNVGPPGGIAQNAVPEVWLPTEEYLFNSQMDILGNGALAIGSDVKAIFVGSGTVPTNGFLTGTACRNLDVRNIHFENFTTVFAVSTNNADSSQWVFDHVGGGDLNLFVDMLNHSSSRSTIVTFNSPKFVSGVRQLGKFYCDSLNINDPWFQGSSGTLGQLDFIFANSNITINGGLFASAGTAAADRSWIKHTNDDGAGGTTSERTRNVTINGPRFSNDPAGQATLLVCDFPAIGTTDVSPCITLINCNVGLFKGSTSVYESGNSEGGAIYLLQFPGSINIVGGSYHYDATQTLNNESLLIAKSDSLALSSAPDGFNIWLDDSAYSGVQRATGAVAAWNFGSLAGFINNPDPFTFRGLLEDGHLDVTDAVTGIYTIVDFTSIAGATCTIDGTNITLTTVTEGVDWFDTTSNEATAISLASALTAITGVTAAASGAVVTVTPDSGAVLDTFSSNAGADIAVQAPMGLQKASFIVDTNFSAFNHLPIAFELLLCGLSANTSPSTAFAGSSRYSVSFNGISDSGNKSRITSTLIHEDTGGFGATGATSIVSLHFGSAETGSNTAAAGSPFTMTVVYGTNIGEGTARLSTLVKWHNRNSGNPR